MNVFGYNHSTKYKIEIKDGELVTVMLLRRTFPSAYMKSVSEQNAREKEIAGDLGTEAEEIKPSHKDGGVAWEYAIIERYSEDTGCFEQTLQYDDDGDLLLPEYNIFGLYQQYPPKYIHDNNLGFSNIIRGGSEYMYSGNDNVVIMQHFPGTLPEKDWGTGFTADMITDEILKAEHQDLWEKEKRRLASWNDILFKWIGYPEAYALEKLEEMISSRLLLYTRVDRTINYHRPEQGMTFTARVSRRSRYMDIIAFEWDKNEQQYKYYSQGINHIGEEEKRLAASLLYKSSLISSSEADEEVPF